MNGSASGDTSSEELLFETIGNVGVVTFNRPAARNALTFAIYDKLAEICRNMPADGEVKALIITGAGDKSFASGTDISQFRDFSSGRDGLAYEARMERVMRAVEQCSIPTIAAIAGACTGGGAVLASLCDIRIATSALKFGFPIARTLGNCLSAQNLSRIVAMIGTGRTKDLIFLSRLMGADEALACGLISEIVPDHEALMRRAHDVAAQITTQAPLTMRAGKQMLTRMRGGIMEDRDLIELCYGSEDFAEGVAAFLGRRKPRWRGR